MNRDQAPAADRVTPFRPVRRLFYMRGGTKRGWATVCRQMPASYRGFTLVEVTLVLALLVVIGALAVPMLGGSFNRGQLLNGGEVVRTVWMQARLAAMESGEAQLFRCEMKGYRFQVISLAEFAATGGETPAPEEAAEELTNSLRLDFTRLPGGVTFVSGQFAPSPQLAAMLGEVSDNVWSAPIVFRPDGTCTDATVLLANERGQTLRVTLRGITGTARFGEVGAEEAPLQ